MKRNYQDILNEIIAKANWMRRSGLRENSAMMNSDLDQILIDLNEVQRASDTHIRLVEEAKK